MRTSETSKISLGNQTLASSEKVLSRCDIFFSVVFLIGLYTDIFYYFNEKIFIPNILCFISSFYFFYKNFNEINAHQVAPLLFIYALTLIGILVAPAPFLYFIERFKGFIQLVTSTIIGYLFFIHMRRFPTNVIETIFLYFIIFIVIGAFLEIYTPFKLISDNFRYLVFKNGIYANDTRDLFLFKQIRPKLFTSEPSHVAKFYLLSILVWHSLTSYRYKYIMLLFFIASGFFLIRSPILILVGPLILLSDFFITKKIVIKNIILKFGPVIKHDLFITIVFVFIIVLITANTIFSQRYKALIKGKDASTAIRTYGAAKIIPNVLKRYPLMGAGITGKEAIYDIIKYSYFNVNVTTFNLHSFTANYLILLIIYYGILGSTLFILAFIIFCKRLKVPNILFVITSICIFSQTMGGFVGVRVWAYIYIILLVSFFSIRPQVNNI